MMVQNVSFDAKHLLREVPKVYGRVTAHTIIIAGPSEYSISGQTAAMRVSGIT